jgi:alginate O-acetyltransferase complex protein AlgI
MYLILAINFSFLAILLSKLPYKNINLYISYLFFFICPILTYFKVLGVLTGFNSIYANSIYFGLSFYTLNIAYHLLKSSELIKYHPLNFFLSIINPLYLFTGPFPNKIRNTFVNFNLKILKKRVEYLHTEFILGVFFAAILAPSLKPLLSLKESYEILDILFFGIIFELYVYFNFAGFSMVMWFFMRLFGIKVQKNFNQPFSANSIVEYWRRWHITYSNILKVLFFNKLKVKIGLFKTTFIIFLASAMWHGISTNFLIWGLVHSFFWCISHYFYKKNFKILNYFLLFFGVIFGRIIFSEINIDILFTKIKIIFNISHWSFNCMNNIDIYKIGYIKSFNILIAFFLIFLEMFVPIYFKSSKYYNYLKTPIVSTLILLYICLFFVGFNDKPIYGGR